MSQRRLDGDAGEVRLQKILASAGLGSRRACEELIAAGRVQVNGITASLGTRADPARDVIRVDGDRLPTAGGLVHLAVHKPRGMLSAMSDASGRSCVGDLVRDRGSGMHHVGRLDVDSEGLLLVTNDGALSHRLMHPSYEVPKRYLVEIEGVPPRALGRLLRQGVELDDGPARVDSFAIVDTTPRRSSVEVVLHEGRKHVVRRMFGAAGHPVRRLVRTSIGPIRLGDLPPGKVRRLSVPEVQSLYRLTDL
ncbi:MAG TPA: pseudouridine synthase [Mycobacteriales bacterium]|nr:pseudouridine synthase [Mycobacteriales bacterium]